MKHLADDFTAMAVSPSPKDVYCYSPGLLRLPSGRLVGTMDFGGSGVGRMPGAVREGDSGFWFLGKVFTSDDGGATWQERATLSMYHMRPFLAGDTVYVIGHHGDLAIARSDDGGITWSPLCDLTQGQIWHQAPSNVWYKEDKVYLVMERMTHQRSPWPVCSIAPVLMRGCIQDDLTRRESWTFASELVFDQEICEEALTDFGIPFYDASIPGGHGYNTRLGWLETNVVQLLKPNDWFYDPTGRTFHLFMRSYTGLTWTGALAKVVEQEDGSLITQFEHAPSGKRMVFTHIPGGGQSKFHLLYDEQTKTYWLLSNQYVDGMVNFNQMTHNERHGYDRSRLTLHYSYNCFDWLFAGVVCAGKTLRQSRSYASMVFDGDDLLVLSRTGDERALNGHDTNLITFHRVRSFRTLIDE